MPYRYLENIMKFTKTDSKLYPNCSEWNTTIQVLEIWRNNMTKKEKAKMISMVRTLKSVQKDRDTVESLLATTKLKIGKELLGAADWGDVGIFDNIHEKCLVLKSNNEMSDNIVDHFEQFLIKNGLKPDEIYMEVEQDDGE